MAQVQGGDLQNILAPHWATTPLAEQNAVLQALKNEVVGHTQKKEKWVRQGVLAPIVHVLATGRSSAKLNGKEAHARHHAVPSRSLSNGEQARLQALELLNAFAYGGAPFLDPLAAAGALPAILSHITPVDNHPKLVLTALRALVSLSRSSLLAPSPCPLDTTSLAQMIFSKPHLESLHAILSPTTTIQWLSQAQINTIATIIGILCREEHQMALANAGILDALATRLTSFAVSRGQVIPGAETLAQNDGIAEAIPAPALPSADIGAILEAISAIVGESRLRACMLLCSHSILAVFPFIPYDGTAPEPGSTWTSLGTGGIRNLRDQKLNVVDHLLPSLPNPQSKSSIPHLSPFPPLRTSLSRDNQLDLRTRNTNSFKTGLTGWDNIQIESYSYPDEDSDESGSDDPESPLIPWLVNLARSTEGNERLMAASLLTSIYKSGFASESRETTVGALVAPLLLQLLSDMQDEALTDLKWIDPETHERWTRTVRTLTVLARLVSDSEYLQKCAYDCNAVKIISGFLKASYEPLPSDSHRRPWNPSPEVKREGSPELDRERLICTLGPPGQSVIHTRRAQLRESALKAMAAITASKEEYRKGFVEQDTVQFVVESLNPKPSKPTNDKDRATVAKPAADSAVNEAAYGTNCSRVLIAACHCLRMLSRSPSILRTTLQDASIAMPVFHLLRHPDLEAQVIATGVICNLVTDVSPMQEEYMEAGVMNILCEHAHSLHAPLRLNAVWALKHLVLGTSSERKKNCLETLEPGWLVQLICDDTEDEALFARTESEKQATQAADRMDDDAMEEDVEMTQPPEATTKWAPTNSWQNHHLPEPETSHLRSRVPRLRRGETRITKLRDAELNQVRKARNDDLAIQEQALLFIRNFIVPGPENKDATEMVDYLFEQLGQDRLFEILASKLKVKVLHPFSRRGGTGTATVLYPQARIIEAVVYLLVHISASVPRHRQLVISQTELLKALTAHFNSRDKEVRVSLCHLLGNLSWIENASDEMAATHRALELKRLGLLTKLEALEQDDQELDVRERAKTAIHQMNHPGQ